MTLEFTDGSSGAARPDLVDWGRGGVIAPLQDPDFFARVTVHREAGTLAWPNGVDLDPDMLYDAAHGVGLLPLPYSR